MKLAYKILAVLIAGGLAGFASGRLPCGEHCLRAGPAQRLAIRRRTCPRRRSRSKAAREAAWRAGLFRGSPAAAAFCSCTASGRTGWRCWAAQGCSTRRGSRSCCSISRRMARALAGIITFGYLESRDARAAFDFMRQRLPGEHIGVVGMSLGGAAAILSEKPLEADAMVLEAVFRLVRRGARQPDGDAIRVVRAVAVSAA